VPLYQLSSRGLITILFELINHARSELFNNLMFNAIEAFIENFQKKIENILIPCEMTIFLYDKVCYCARFLVKLFNSSSYESFLDPILKTIFKIWECSNKTIKFCIINNLNIRKFIDLISYLKSRNQEITLKILHQFLKENSNICNIFLEANILSNLASVYKYSKNVKIKEQILECLLECSDNSPNFLKKLINNDLFFFLPCDSEENNDIKRIISKLILKLIEDCFLSDNEIESIFPELHKYMVSNMKENELNILNDILSIIKLFLNKCSQNSNKVYYSIMKQIEGNKEFKDLIQKWEFFQNDQISNLAIQISDMLREIEKK